MTTHAPIVEPRIWPPEAALLLRISNMMILPSHFSLNPASEKVVDPSGNDTQALRSS
jgi:hypothetical protein